MPWGEGRLPQYQRVRRRIIHSKMGTHHGSCWSRLVDTNVKVEDRQAFNTSTPPMGSELVGTAS